jgi:hypothetical protein
VLPECCFLAIGARVASALGLPGFHRIPELLRNDAQAWNILDDPRLARIEARLAPTGLGVLHELKAVPHELPDVELVVENRFLGSRYTLWLTDPTSRQTGRLCPCG